MASVKVKVKVKVIVKVTVKVTVKVSVAVKVKYSAPLAPSVLFHWPSQFIEIE